MAAIIVVLLVLGLVSAILQGLAIDNGNHSLAGYLGVISPFSLVDGVQVWLFGATPRAQAGPPGTAGGLVFVVVTIAVIAACYGWLQLRYRKVAAS